MGNTFSQVHIQLVMAVKYRQSLIAPHWKNELCKFLTGLIESHQHKMLQVNGMPDHMHIFFGMRPAQSISHIAQYLKSESTKWINQHGFCREKFQWQEGYGAFSYSRKDVPAVAGYIQNQEQHHRKKPFIEEFRDLLIEHEIGYDERYLFIPPI
jgi:putative transposase